MKRPYGTGSLFHKPTSRHWWIKYHSGGRVVRESTRTANKIVAQRILSDKVSPTLQAASDPRMSRVTVADLAAMVKQDYRMNHPRSLSWMQRCWNKHLEPMFGRMRASELTTEALNLYAAKRGDAGAGNATINREFAILKRAMYMGFECTPRKVHAVPTFPRLTEPAARSGFVDDAKYRKLCENCGAELWLRTLLALGYTYGFRKSELLNMRMRQVDLLNRSITLDPGTTKNGQGRIVKMTTEVYQLLLAAAHGKQPGDFVLSRDGGPVRDFRGAFYALCVRAGLGKWVKGADKKERWEGLIFHDLRRSAVRNMVRRGVSEKIAMRISGHKTRSVFDRYNIVNEDDLARAALLIERGAGQEARAEFGHTLGTPAGLQDGKDVLKSI